jgi:hypothetical protein
MPFQIAMCGQIMRDGFVIIVARGRRATWWMGGGRGSASHPLAHAKRCP